MVFENGRRLKEGGCAFVYVSREMLGIPGDDPIFGKHPTPGLRIGCSIENAIPVREEAGP
jgi:hypothetical protein